MRDNEKFSKEMLEKLAKEVNQFKNEVSFYPTTRKNKDGVTVPSGYGLAFYYIGLDGKKQRKVFTSKAKEDLLPKRTAFLTALFFEKQAQVEKMKNIEMLSDILPASLLKEDIHCDKTVNEAIDLYLPSHKARVKYKTHVGEISNSQHVRKWLGSKMVNELTFNDHQDLLNNVAKGRNGKLASKKLVRNIKGFFGRLIQFCKKQKWLSAEEVEFILDGVVMPTTARKNRNAKYLPIAEMGKVLNILQENRRYYLISKILLLTGMRGQEIFALEKQDLKPQMGIIYVRQALEEQEKTKETDRKYKIGETKNEESERYAPAIPEVFECFKELEEIQVKNGWREKSYALGNGNMAIIDSLGQVVDKTCFNRNMNEFLKRHGAENKLTLHMPRHCFATYLKLRNADIENVEFAMGHSFNGVRYEYLADIVPEYVIMLFPKIEEMARDIRQAEKRAKQEAE